MTLQEPVSDLPLGTMLSWPDGRPPPQGWALCDGALVPRHLQRILLIDCLPELPGLIMRVEDKIHPRWHPKDL